MKALVALMLLMAVAHLSTGQGGGPPADDTTPSPTSRPPTTAADEGDDMTTVAEVDDTNSTTPAPTAPSTTGAPEEYTVEYKGGRRVYYYLLACEGMVTKLACPENHFLYFYDVFWGRSSSGTCKGDGMNLDLECENDDAKEILEGMCYGENSCEFMASAGTFGALCNTPKYLRITYQCYTPLYHTLACEQSGKLTLTCPVGKFLTIQDAFYGRDGSSTCPHSALADTDCEEPNAFEMVATMCDGKKACDLEAINDIFGNPCAGTHKYLTADFTCDECLNAHDSDADCNYWASLGYCWTNREWMSTNCRKTCWKCGDPEDEVCENGYGDDAYCDYNAGRGECEVNPVWMMAYCRKSCLKCDNLTPCVNRRGDDDLCDDYRGRDPSQCKDNVYWMHQHCAKSCFECDTEYIECKDRNTNCEQWANEEECQKNPGYMIPWCTRSCTGCTSAPVCENELDDFASCEYWASIGECEKNPAYMYKKCWKSCMNCGDPPRCVNEYGDDKQCEIWKDEGQCDNNMAWMTAFCKKTCLDCDLMWSNNRKGCVNLESDSKCEHWKSTGECELNPIWMHAKCLKSCTECDNPLKCENRADHGKCEYWAMVGECSNNADWMYLNCRLSCTRCGPLNYTEDCYNNNDECDKWASEGECQKNPDYMLVSCKRACTPCEDYLSPNYQLLRTGNPPTPGEPAVITRHSTILLPQEVPSYGRLINFEVFFRHPIAMHVQIWRHNSDDGWFTVFDQRVVPDHRNTVQTVAATWGCFKLWTGDRIGFTTFGNVAPVAAIFDASMVFKTSRFHDAGTNRGFTSINLPYRFSIRANIEMEGDC